MRQAAGWPAAGAALAATSVLLLMLGGSGAAAARAPGDACGGDGHGLPDRVRHRVTHRVRDSPGPGSAHGYRVRRAVPARDARLPADLPGAAAAVPGLPAAAGRARTA